jgi:hypothetical protein
MPFAWKGRREGCVEPVFVRRIAPFAGQVPDERDNVCCGFVEAMSEGGLSWDGEMEKNLKNN